MTLPKSREWAVWPLERMLIPPLEPIDVVDVSLEEAITGQSNVMCSAEYANLIQQSQILQEQATRCMLEEDSTGELMNLKMAVDLFQDFDGISPFSFDLYTVRCAYLTSLLAAVSVGEGNILAAVGQCEHIVSFLVISLSHVTNHPLLGLQLYTLGDLYLAAADIGSDEREGTSNLNLHDKAMRAYTWARDVMLVTHGLNNDMVRTLEENIRSSR